MNKALLLLTLLGQLSAGYAQKKIKSPDRFATGADIINDICFTPNGELLAVADDRTIKLFVTSSKALTGEFRGHTGQVQSLDISADSAYLASGGKDSTVMVWDFKTFTRLQSHRLHHGVVTSVALSPNSRYVASAGTDNKIFLYDLGNKKPAHEFSIQGDAVTSIAFSRDGNFLAAAGSNKAINIYHTGKGVQVATLTGHGSWVREVSFSADGTRLISCGDNAHVRIWKLTDLQNISVVYDERHAFTWITSVDLHQDDKSFVVGDLQGEFAIAGHFGTYKGKAGSPISRIRFVPRAAPVLKIAVATRGRGVFLVSAMQMKFVR